jgi:two-component system phosphate regulon sensor histidine kinase PhoR
VKRDGLLVRRAGPTTIIELLTLSTSAIFIGSITGEFTRSALAISVAYLLLTIWRRNRFYEWLEKQEPNSSLWVSDMWRDMVKRIELRQAALKKENLLLERKVDNLHRALSSLNVGLVKVDSDWRLEWWNGQASKLLMLKLNKDLGTHLFSLIRNPALREYAENREFTEPLILTLHSQRRIVLEHFIGSVNQGGYIILIRDISHFQRLEEMRTDFVANVSHELKTPLTVIIGYIETLLENNTVPENMYRALANSLTQGLRMKTIIQELLILSNLETTKASEQTEIQLLDLVSQVISHTDRLKETILKTETKIISKNLDQTIIIGNWNELFSLFSNLLSNAIQYCPNGSTIQICFTLKGDQGIIAVKDDGPGIPHEHLDRLTERFYRVDNSHSRETGGTGLGLAIAKHILSRHDADLKIRSQVNDGSTFGCHFPKNRIIQNSISEED